MECIFPLNLGGAIGVGKQRTTRFNRVYEWKNIRIIDTPGIGAPGGKSDEEIAESIIEESDVICYVVTNDSIQETEFNKLAFEKGYRWKMMLLINQIHLQLWEFEQKVYGEIDRQIAAVRQQEENAIAASSTWVKQIVEIRKDFELILAYITKATENQIL